MLVALRILNFCIPDIHYDLSPDNFIGVNQVAALLFIYDVYLRRPILLFDLLRTPTIVSKSSNYFSNFDDSTSLVFSK